MMNDEQAGERAARASVLQRIGSFFALHDEEDDAFADEAPQERRNVVAFSAAASRRGAGAEVGVYAPRAFGEVTVIADALRARTVAIVNLQGIDRALLQRIVDFTSGVAYTLDGKMQKLAEGMYLVVPPGVTVNAAGIQQSLAADPAFDFMTQRG